MADKVTGEFVSFEAWLGELGLEASKEVLEGFASLVAHGLRIFGDKKGSIWTDGAQLMAAAMGDPDVMEGLGLVSEAIAEAKDLKGWEYPALVEILAREVKEAMQMAEPPADEEPVP